jgi:hypothetical protein
MTNLVERVQKLIMTPKAEWTVIDGESIELQGVLTRYVAPLAAIPAVAGFIGLTVLGMGPIKFGLMTGLSIAITQFILAVLFVPVLAWIIDLLAPMFGAQKNFSQALKVAAFFPTAAWVAGVFQIIPALGIIGLLGGVYSLYHLFVGLPRMMKPPAEKAVPYTLVTIVAAIVASLVLGAVVGALTPKPKLGDLFSDIRLENAARLAQSSAASTGDRTASIDDLEKAAESGDLSAVFGAIGGLAGADPDAPLLDTAKLRTLAPEKLAGLDRVSLDASSIDAPFKASILTAEYGDGEKRISLKFTNSQFVSAMMGAAGLAGATFERETADGFERMRKDGDAIVVEEWSKASGVGRYGRSVAGSFLIEAEGTGVDFKELERVVRSFDEDRLKRLATSG